MFRISIIETSGQRRLILEGQLIPPCTEEVERAWKTAAEQLEGRKLVVDLTNVTLVGQEGENTLFKLMREGATFRCGDIFTKHLVKGLDRKFRCPE
jgi:hypothetical protein